MSNPISKDDRRVIIFLHAFSAGGAEAVMVKLANDLHARGMDVVLIAARAEGPNRRYLSDEIEVVDLAARRMSLALPALCRELRRRNPTVCLSALTHANIALIAAARVVGLKARVVVSERLSLQFDAASSLAKRYLKRHLIGQTYPRADRIIVVAEAIGQEFRDMYPAAAQKVIALPNPVDIGRIRTMSEDPSAFSVAHVNGPVIAFVGRLSRQKNLAMLLRAFGALRRRMPATLVLSGDGPMRHELEKLAADLSLSTDVKFPGYLDNPYRLMREADVLALSSDFEGLPNVLIEALALGTQIVSTDCPTGPAEITRNGAYGRLAPCGDENAFADALQMAIQQPLKFDRDEAIAPYRSENALAAYREVLFG